MFHDVHLHLVHPVPLRDLPGGGDVTHDDGVVLVQPGLIQHTPPCRNINRSKVVRLKDTETPVKVRLLLFQTIYLLAPVTMNAHVPV